MWAARAARYGLGGGAAALEDVHHHHFTEDRILSLALEVSHLLGEGGAVDGELEVVLAVPSKATEGAHVGGEVRTAHGKPQDANVGAEAGAGDRVPPGNAPGDTQPTKEAGSENETILLELDVAGDLLPGGIRNDDRPVAGVIIAPQEGRTVVHLTDVLEKLLSGKMTLPRAGSKPYLFGAISRNVVTHEKAGSVSLKGPMVTAIEEMISASGVRAGILSRPFSHRTASVFIDPNGSGDV